MAYRCSRCEFDAIALDSRSALDGATFVTTFWCEQCCSNTDHIHVDLDGQVLRQ